MKNYKYLFFVFIFIISCKKEDTQSPEIDFFKPTENQVFNFNDTITINAKVTDDKKIGSISIAIYDLQNNIVSNQISIQPEDKLINILTEIIINNREVETGYHYLNIKASDGYNTKTKNLSIYIKGFEKKFLGLHIIQNNNNSTKISFIDTSLTIFNLLTISGDYSCSEIVSKYNILFIAGAKTGNLSAIDLIDNSIIWTLPNQMNNTVWFRKILFYNNLLHISTNSSNIDTYNIKGQKNISYFIQENNICYNFYISENRILFATNSKYGSYDKLFQYYFNSNMVVTSQNIFYKIVDWSNYENENIYIFANNSNNNGVILLYNYNNSIFTELYLLNNEKIYSVSKIYNKNYLILTNKKVYWFNNSGMLSMASIITISEAQELLFETMNQIIFIVKENKIYNYSFPEGILRDTYQMNDTIKKIHLYYNK